MLDPIVVVGAGGFSRETVDVIQALDDASSSGVQAVVLDQCQIGAWAVVGAAACVVKNVNERAVVVGVPAVEREQTA